MRTDAVSLNAERFTGQGTSFVQLFPLTVPDTLSRRVPRQLMKRADLLMIFRLPIALTGAIASWPLFILPFQGTRLQLLIRVYWKSRSDRHSQPQ